jgi:arginase family enzyme
MPLAIAYLNNPYSHASVMARVYDDGLSLVQVGIRSISPEEMSASTTVIVSQHSLPAAVGSFRSI